MTPTSDDSQTRQLRQADFQAALQEKLRQAVRLTLVTVLDAEVEAFIGAAPYERSPQRRDHRNGT